MKKFITTHQLMALLAIGGSMMLAGCTNEDYDFDKVDYTLGFGGDRLSLPGSNSTAEIQLDDLLDISGSDLISTTADGDYVFGKEPDGVNPVSVTVDPITLHNDQSRGLSFDISLPQDLLPLVGQVIQPADYGMSLEEEGQVSLLDYEFQAPDAVKSLQSVGLGDGGVDLSLNLLLPACVRRFGNIVIDLPDFLRMTCTNVPPGGTFDVNANKLTLTDYTGGDLTLNFKVTSIDVANSIVDTDNYAMFENGIFSLKGYVVMSLRVDELEVPSATVLQLSGVANFQDVTITSAHGQFDPAINLQEAGTVTINSIPDFLTDQEVVADLDNPQIWLTLRSTMPLGGTIEATLTSDTYPQGVVLDGNKTIRVKGSADGQTEMETKVLICRNGSGVDNMEYQVIEVEDLSKLVNTLREGMQIKFGINEVKATQETATIQLGHKYHLTPAYRFTAPLAFGPEAVIVYSKMETGWNDDIDELALANNAYVHLKGTAVNKIPANLTLDITPLGTNGQALSDVKVELIQNQVTGTKNAAVESPIEVKISGNVKKLDGITLKLKAESNEALRGVTLNKSAQTLLLKDISIDLVGKLIYDAN